MKMSSLIPTVLSEAEEIAIRSFANNVGTQWGDFVSTALSEFLILVVALRKPTKVVQMSSETKPVAVPQQVERLLPADDVARRLNISKSKAYQLLQRGEIPCIRIERTTRVRPADLEAYIKQKPSLIKTADFHSKFTIQ
jgi:excisionase family DNA binding protein